MQDTKYKELKMDRYQYGLILQILNNHRNKLIEEKKPTSDIDIIIVNLISAKQKNKNIFAKDKRDYAER